MTYTGQGFDPYNPDPKDIKLADIAHQLSMIARYGGAAPVFYSVARHAITVADIVWRATNNPRWTLWALHHDSAEAYIGDIRRPLKARMTGFAELEARVLQTIAKGLNLPKLGDDHAQCMYLVELADNAVLEAEMIAFFRKKERDEIFVQGELVSIPPLQYTNPVVDRQEFTGMHIDMYSEAMIQAQAARRAAEY